MADQYFGVFLRLRPPAVDSANALANQTPADDEVSVISDSTSALSRPSSSKSDSAFERLAQQSRSSEKVSISDFSIDVANPCCIRVKGHPYVFDGILDDRTTQEMVYDRVVKDLLTQAFKGLNVTVFTYGRTGSGKTHTLIGDDSRPGILPRCISGFTVCPADTSITTIKLAMCEMSGRSIYDLDFPMDSELAESKARRNQVEDMVYSHVIDELVFRPVESLSSLKTRIERNLDRRSVAETKLNKSSTRAHTVIVIELYIREQVLADAKDAVAIAKGSKSVKSFVTKRSKICLVDMCGSEDIRESGVEGEHLKTTIKINSSLTNFVTVMTQLAAPNVDRDKLSLRNSDIAFLLKENLVSNAVVRVVICANLMFPAESLRALRFGMTLRKIKYHAKVNSIETNAQLRAEIARLKARISELELLVASQNDRLQLAVKTLRDNGIALENLTDGTESSAANGSNQPIVIGNKLDLAELNALAQAVNVSGTDSDDDPETKEEEKETKEEQEGQEEQEKQEELEEKEKEEQEEERGKEEMKTKLQVIEQSYRAMSASDTPLPRGLAETPGTASSEDSAPTSSAGLFKVTDQASKIQEEMDRLAAEFKAPPPSPAHPIPSSSSSSLLASTVRSKTRLAASAERVRASHLRSSTLTIGENAVSHPSRKLFFTREGQGPEQKILTNSVVQYLVRVASALSERNRVLEAWLLKSNKAESYLRSAERVELP